MDGSTKVKGWIDNTASNPMYGYYSVVLVYFRCPKCGEEFLDDVLKIFHRCPVCETIFFRMYLKKDKFGGE